MQKRLPSSMALLVAILSLSLVALAQNADHRHTAGARNAPTANAQPFDPHDLSGLWDLTSHDLEISANPPPMTAWGKAKFDSYKPSYGPRAIPPGLGNDPMDKCDPLGMPRLLFYGPTPIEFLQTPGKITLLMEIHEEWQTIWTDGRPLPAHLDPWWMGHSVGHWDADTLVVDSNGFDERTWLDHFGDPHSGEMQLEYRWHRVDHDTLELTMTLTDPKTYTEPWVSDKKIYKLDTHQKEMTEFFCVPSEEEEFDRRIVNPAAGKVH